MDAQKAVELIDRVVYATMARTAAWQRGIQGKQQEKAKVRAIEELFQAMVGRKPTKEEHEGMCSYAAASM